MTGMRGKYQRELGWWHQRAQVSRRQTCEGVIEGGGQEAKGKRRKSLRMETEEGKGWTQPGLREIGDLCGKGRLRINHCRQLLRRGHPLASLRSHSPSPLQSLKPRPSPARSPGTGFPLSRGPIVPAVARERKVYADGLCRRWARGE